MTERRHVDILVDRRERPGDERHRIDRQPHPGALIGAADLIPQLTVREDWQEKLLHTGALFLGLAILLVTA